MRFALGTLKISLNTLAGSPSVQNLCELCKHYECPATPQLMLSKYVYEMLLAKVHVKANVNVVEAVIFMNNFD